MRLNDSSQGVIHHVAKIRKILQVEQIAKLILNATQKKQRWRGELVHAITAISGNVDFLIQRSVGHVLNAAIPRCRPYPRQS